MKEVRSITLYGLLDDDSVYPNHKFTNVYTGDQYSVIGSDLIDSMNSSSVYLDVKKVTKTIMAERLVGAGALPFKVVFIKSDGSERELVGRLISSEHLLGRSMVEDLLLPIGENRIRQVDHRTLESLIIDEIKYELR